MSEAIFLHIIAITWTYPVLATVSHSYSWYRGRSLTRYSPVRHSTQAPKNSFAFDLHVLSTPPAFVLSQDQTLQFDILNWLLSYFSGTSCSALLFLSQPIPPEAKSISIKITADGINISIAPHPLGPFAVCCYSVFKDHLTAPRTYIHEKADSRLHPRQGQQLNQIQTSCQYLSLPDNHLSTLQWHFLDTTSSYAPRTR